jgi:hypothetical protein
MMKPDLSPMSTDLTLTLSSLDRLTLEWAHAQLEHPSFAVRVSNLLGWPLEHAIRLLPNRVHTSINILAEASIKRALRIAVTTLNQNPAGPAHDRMHRALCVASGALGGYFGLPGMLVEMPISTSLMLRAIADIARREGEDLGRLESRMACLEVFAIGGYSPEDDAADTGYYGLRLALGVTVSQATGFIVRNGLSREGAPVIVRLLTALSSRFGLAVSEKAAAQAVPFIGAAGGATINLLFMQHFQKMAHAHFTLRRLERQYGQPQIRAAYESLARI